MKLLFIDIETSPNTAFVWGLWNQNISISNLIDSGTVMCYAAKWLGSDEVMFDSIFNSRPRIMLKRVHKLLDEADAVIHYNGSRFDIPVLNKEFLLHGFAPPAPFKQIDLLTTARRKFRFASNKLDYVAQQLGVGSKHKHEGFELWIKCMNKDPEAWKSMEKYNKQDVVLLEKVYEVFKPWIKGHPNIGVFMESDRPVCPVCSSDRIIKRGFAVTTTRKYQRYQCRDCGHWSRAGAVTGNTLVSV